jgi:hypothetical protein
MFSPHRPRLSFNDDGFGSPSHVEVVHADTFLELRNAIRDRRWKREIHSPYDCTGICFASNAKILHAARTDAYFSAVLLVTRHFDV